MPTSDGNSELARLREHAFHLHRRVTELEHANRELEHFAVSARLIRDTLVKMLARSIEESNHWKAKVMGGGIEDGK